MVLTLAMIASMIVLPVGAYDISSVDTVTDPTGICPCGCNTAIDQIDWQKWNVNEKGDPTQGHFYLDGNYVQDSEVRIIAGLDIVLDLRGYTLTTAGASRVAIVNGHFSVMDTVGGGRLSAITSTSSGGVIAVQNNETTDACFSLYSGTITPDPSSTKLPANGGLVFVYTGTEFYMHGGTLLGGKTSTQGGNLCAQTDTVVSITGGSIIGGTAGKHGGNIYTYGEITLNNCQVIGGTAAGWGGNMYITGGSLSATNAVIRSGMAKCDDTISTNNNGGGNICCLSNSTSSFTNCTITGGYTAKNGGNLYLGSGNHTVTGGTVSGGTGGYNGNNIYGTGNVTLDGCSVSGDVEYNSSSNSLTLKGATKIGLLNTGLNIANTKAQVTVSGLTSGAEVYLNANGVTLANANMSYFKPAIRTTLTQSGTSITAAYAADGETAGYCPHCNAKVAWTPLAAATVATTSGHYYITGATSLSNQLAIGRNITDSSVDAVVDLNGYTVTCSGRFAYIYDDATVGNGHSLSVLDSAGNSLVTGKGTVAAQNGGVLYNEKNLTIYGGTFRLVTSTTRSAGNGGVVHNGGTFNMHGGILDGSAYDRETALALKSDATCNGGALFMGNGATRQFNMSAGHIIGGKAFNGGSIYFGYNNVVNITGGSITGGTASKYGGNLGMHYELADDGTKDSVTDSNQQSADINISGCSITDGSSSKYGGNIFSNWCALDIDDCYIAGGSATSHGGNLFCNTGLNMTVDDSVILSGSSKVGGNGHMAGTGVTSTFTDCLIASGKATSYGGNLCLGNGYNTIDGGAVLYGYANNPTATSNTAYGGNISSGAGNVSATSKNYSTIKGNTLIAGGYSATTGGNIQANGVLNLTSATIRGGKAGNGQDIYLAAFDKQQKLTVGSGVTGSMLLYVEESTHLTDPVYGTAIAKTACETLNASIYLENEGYGNPMLIAEGGALCVGAIAVQRADGTAQWFTDADDAMAAYEDGSVLLLATDSELTLTQDCTIDVCGSTVTVHGNYKVAGMDSANDNYTASEGKLVFADLEDANTDPVTPVSAGSMYVAVTEGNTATYHRLDFGIDSISIRPTSCGIYYNGTWSCDEVLAEKIDTYGIALSLKSMPTANFIAEEDSNGNMWTEPTDPLGVGVNSTSVLISGIMQTGETYTDEAQTPVSAAENDSRGRRPIYATAYVTIGGNTYISDDSTTENDDVDYSLYSAMDLMDQLIAEQPEWFRRYSNAMRAFYDIWNEYGMESWDFQQVYIPAEDNVIDVLMIGSSFCYYYVEELAQLAAEAGVEMRVCNAYHSGGKLFQHYDWWQDGAKEYQFFETTVKADGTVSRVKTAPVNMEWCLMQQQWDVISLQEHTVSIVNAGAIEHQEATQQYYKPLFTYLREQFPEAQLLFQQTWAYQPGYDFSGFQMVDTAQQTANAAAVKEYAEAVCADLVDLGVGIVPSGSAWQNVRNGAFGTAFDNLCARISSNAGKGDYYHEGDIGGAQYLNACVWFEVITGLDCRDYDSFIPFYSSSALAADVVAAVNVDTVTGGYSLTEEFVNILQECAHAAVEAAYPEN